MRGKEGLILNLGLALVMLAAACQPKKSGPESLVAAGTATPTFEPSPVPSATSTPHRVSEVVVNGMTGATFESVPDPEKRGRQCLKLGVYSQANKQDVFGAAVALGPDPDRYNDTSGPITVYDSRGVEIGSFDTSVIPGSEFSRVQPGTVVCGGSAVHQ